MSDQTATVVVDRVGPDGEQSIVTFSLGTVVDQPRDALRLTALLVLEALGESLPPRSHRSVRRHR